MRLIVDAAGQAVKAPMLNTALWVRTHRLLVFAQAPN